MHLKIKGFEKLFLVKIPDMNLMTHNNLSFRDFFQTKILVTLSIRNDIVHLIISNPFINDAQIYS